MELTGDMWKYGDPPAVTELRKHIQKKSRLLLIAPGAANPFEAYITKISPNEEFVYFTMAGALMGVGYWLDINNIRVLDVLPILPPQTPRSSLLNEQTDNLY